MDDDGHDRGAEQHPAAHVQPQEEVERQQQRHQRAADVDRDDRRPALHDRRRQIRPAVHRRLRGRRHRRHAHREQRNVDLTAEQGHQHHDEHPARRDADLPVGIAQDPQLDDQHHHDQ